MREILRESGHQKPEPKSYVLFANLSEQGVSSGQGEGPMFLCVHQEPFRAKDWAGSAQWGLNQSINQ